MKKFAAALFMISIIMVGSLSIFYMVTHAPEKQEQQAKEETAGDIESPESSGSSEPAQQKPDEALAKKLTAPYVSQRPELPNGCEITSLTMLLQSAGVKVDKLTLARQIKKVPFQSGTYKGNPNEGFVGNMYHGNRSNPGFAVYHGPIADLARKYLGSRMIDMTGKSWSAVEQQIASGTPVWVITSINFVPVPDNAWQEWPTRQGTIRITFKEHSVLVTGFDADHVYFNDPLAEAAGSKADKKTFIEAWTQFGNQAIAYTGS
ncbi:C39 family peptidase [Sporolactobacillus terrae]|uniref:C39 family peptidase n=1 Tax=Sporolactobacillus terrae TaxID=269673 RepID=UPI001119A485|nr:C39 family peptidase [Sporolactobacillus terrae]